MKVALGRIDKTEFYGFRRRKTGHARARQIALARRRTRKQTKDDQHPQGDGYSATRAPKSRLEMVDQLHHLIEHSECAFHLIAPRSVF
jgi:hypothetical protein